jgi:hypothetical protein
MHDTLIFSIWPGLLTAQILKPCYIKRTVVAFKEQLLSQEIQNISPNCGTITHWFPSRANSRILTPWINTCLKWWPFFELLHWELKVCSSISEEYTAPIFSDHLAQMDTEITERKRMSYFHKKDLRNFGQNLNTLCQTLVIFL